MPVFILLLIIRAENAAALRNGCSRRSVFCVNRSVAVACNRLNKRCSLNVIARNYHNANAASDRAFENFFGSALNVVMIIIRLGDKPRLSFGVKIDCLCLLVCIGGNKRPNSEQGSENGRHQKPLSEAHQAVYLRKKEQHQPSRCNKGS